MVLAAGLGTRMRPLTDHTPKPLITVAGKTLLDYNLDRLEEAGVAEAAINLHYLPEQMERHLAGRARPAITFSDERGQLLDSGGGVKKMLPFFGAAPFFCLNADTIWVDGPKSNLARLAAAYVPEMMDILLLVAGTATAIGWGNRGDFAFDQTGRLRWPNPGEVTPFLYTGVAILRPELFADTPEIFSLNRLFDRAIARGRLFGLRLDGLFMHVGTPEAVAEAELAIQLSRL